MNYLFRITTESRQTAFNKAESGLDALNSIAESVIGPTVPIGYTYCTVAEDKLPVACDANTIVTGWPAELNKVKSQAQITFEGTSPIRVTNGSSTSLQFSHYTLRSVYDDVASKGSTAETVLGSMYLTPSYKATYHELLL